MDQVYHRTSKYVTPHIFVDGDTDALLAHIWETSTSIRDEDRKNPDFVITKTDKLCLDPGGMLNTKIPYRNIRIDGYRFKIQLCAVEQVLKLMEHGVERIPGYMRFPIWGIWCPVLVVMPIGIFRTLQEELQNLLMTDAALHANLEDNEIKAKIRDFQLGKIKNPFKS